MSANGWFAVDQTRRLVPLTDEEIAAAAPREMIETADRISLEKIALDDTFTATDVIRINFRHVPQPAPALPPVAVVMISRERLVAIGLALAAIVALVALL
jgi:hypothetical protein